jgi:hypothetical protein
MLGHRDHDLLRTELEKNEQQKNNLGEQDGLIWFVHTANEHENEKFRSSYKNDGGTNR